MKRYLNELSNEELWQIFDNNNDLQQEVRQIIDDNTYYLIENDYISHFRHYDKNVGREKWSISAEWDAWNNISIKVREEDYKSFLEDCKTLIAYNGCLENLKGLIDRLSERVDFFEDSLNDYTDITTGNWEKLSCWFYEGIENITDTLRAELQEMQDCIYNDDYLFEYFSDGIYLDDTEKYIIDDDFSIVYEDTVKKYA